MSSRTRTYKKRKINKNKRKGGFLGSTETSPQQTSEYNENEERDSTYLSEKDFDDLENSANDATSNVKSPTGINAETKKWWKFWGGKHTKRRGGKHSKKHTKRRK